MISGDSEDDESGFATGGQQDDPGMGAVIGVVSQPVSGVQPPSHLVQIDKWKTWWQQWNNYAVVTNCTNNLMSIKQLYVFAHHRPQKP